MSYQTNTFYKEAPTFNISDVLIYSLNCFKHIKSHVAIPPCYWTHLITKASQQCPVQKLSEHCRMVVCTEHSQLWKQRIVVNCYKENWPGLRSYFQVSSANCNSWNKWINQSIQHHYLKEKPQFYTEPDETDAKMTASPLENWRRLPGRPRIMWKKTIQQDLKSNNLSLNEATDVAQNRPLWRLMSISGVTHSWWCMPEKQKIYQVISDSLILVYDRIAVTYLLYTTLTLDIKLLIHQWEF